MLPGHDEDGRLFFLKLNLALPLLVDDQRDKLRENLDFFDFFCCRDYILIKSGGVIRVAVCEMEDVVVVFKCIAEG